LCNCTVCRESNAIGRGFGLVEQLSAWHDEMVLHARVVARGGVAQCDDSCPRARAVELWRASREILGDAAERLSFLKAAALGPPPQLSSRRRRERVVRIGLPARMTAS
jgi:hypothetical protein